MSRHILIPKACVNRYIQYGLELQYGTYGLRRNWRYHRKICHQTFHQDAAKIYRPIQTRKVHQMLGELLLTPDDFEGHGKM